MVPSNVWWWNRDWAAGLGWDAILWGWPMPCVLLYSATPHGLQLNVCQVLRALA